MWNLRHQNFFKFFSFVKHIVLVSMKWQMFLTCLTTYWQTWLYTAIQTYKPKVQRNLISSDGEPEHFWLYYKEIPKKVILVVSWQALFIWNVSLKYVEHQYQTYLSRFFFISPNFVVLQQFKIKTSSSNIFHQISFHLSYWCL